MWEYNYNYADELYHHGIKGMKWGVRRFQKKDGSLTSAGRKRYITVAEGGLRAEAAATRAKRAAYKQLNESPKRHTKFQYDTAATLAGINARKESVAKDKATNRQLRAEKSGGKQSAKAEYKRAEDAAYKRYEKTINDIEKNYKRGQLLSDKDDKREMEAERKYNNDVAKAKAKYNKAKAVEKKHRNKKVADFAKGAVKVGALNVARYIQLQGIYQVTKVGVDYMMRDR